MPVRWIKKMFSNVSNEQAKKLLRMKTCSCSMIQLWAIFGGRNKLYRVAATGGEAFSVALPIFGTVIASEHKTSSVQALPVEIAATCSRRQLLACGGPLKSYVRFISQNAEGDFAELKLFFENGVYNNSFYADVGGLVIKNGLVTALSHKSHVVGSQLVIATPWFVLTVYGGALTGCILFDRVDMCRISYCSCSTTEDEFRERQFYDMLRRAALLYEFFDIKTVKRARGYVCKLLDVPRWYAVCHPLGLASMCADSKIRQAMINVLMQLGATFGVTRGFSSTPVESLIATIVFNRDCTKADATWLLETACPCWPHSIGSTQSELHETITWIKERCTRATIELRETSVNPTTMIVEAARVKFGYGAKWRELCFDLI